MKHEHRFRWLGAVPLCKCGETWKPTKGTWPISLKRKWRKRLNGVWQASPHNKDRIIDFLIGVIEREYPLNPPADKK